jgi:hypothetical protein
MKDFEEFINDPVFTSIYRYSGPEIKSESILSSFREYKPIGIDPQSPPENNITPDEH